MGDEQRRVRLIASDSLTTPLPLHDEAIKRSLIFSSIELLPLAHPEFKNAQRWLIMRCGSYPGFCVSVLSRQFPERPPLEPL